MAGSVSRGQLGVLFGNRVCVGGGGGRIGFVPVACAEHFGGCGAGAISPNGRQACLACVLLLANKELTLGAFGPGSGALSVSELNQHLTPFDKKRLQAYTNNMVDYHVIMDLIPVCTSAYPRVGGPVGGARGLCGFLMHCVGMRSGTAVVSGPARSFTHGGAEGHPPGAWSSGQSKS
jgi:hypothetical protein